MKCRRHDLALEQVSLAVDHLVKIAEDGGLDALTTSQFVTFTQGFERIRNRLPVADHALIADAERRNLPDVLAHGNLVRTLMATLRLSPGEASRRVRAQAAVGNRHSMTGQPLAPLRPELAAAQRTGDVSPSRWRSSNGPWPGWIIAGSTRPTWPRGSGC